MYREREISGDLTTSSQNIIRTNKLEVQKKNLMLTPLARHCVQKKKNK